MIVESFRQRISVTDRNDVYAEVGIELVGLEQTSWLIFKVRTHHSVDVNAVPYTDEVTFPTLASVEEDLRLNLNMPADGHGYCTINGFRKEADFDGSEEASMSFIYYRAFFGLAIDYSNDRIN